MGFQDRDYYREPDAPGGAFQSMAVKLIALNVGVYLANMFFSADNRSLTLFLALDGDAIVHPWKWYQFLTAGFAHSWESPWHIIGNMLGLYFFGRPLEERYGPREFLRYYLIAIVVGLVAWSIRDYFMIGPQLVRLHDGTTHKIWGVCLGASGGVTACILLFCLLYPRETLYLFFAIPVPAWLVGILLVSSNIFGVRLPGGGEERVAYDVHLTGAAFALAYWYFGLNFGRLPGLGELRRLSRLPRKWFRPRPPLKVHDPERYYEDLDAEGDRLLIKVKQEGLASLTPAERQLLEDYSRRTRQKLR